MRETAKKKIPYDASPIAREYNSSIRQNPSKNRLSVSIFLVAILIFNIISGIVLIGYVLKDKDQQPVNINTEITTEGFVSAVAASKAKLSVVCIGVGGGNKQGPFTEDHLPSYYELFKNTMETGSGVIIDVNKQTDEAYILTCYHVVQNYADYVFVLLYDSSVPVWAKVVGKSISNDVAVLKIQTSQVDGACVAATLTDSSFITEGQDVIAIGNPQSGGFATTKGIISRTSVITESTSGLSLRCIQVDAAINGGNSGGGLFDTNGNLLGIVSSKHSSASIDNVAFAMHINQSISIANNIIDGRQLQYAESGLVLKIDGFDISVINGLIYKTERVLIHSIVDGSDAASSGLKADDRILKIRYNDKLVNIVNSNTYDEIKFDLQVGDTIEYFVERNGEVLAEPIKVTITTLYTAK